jgi:hypothetical protein
VNLTGLDGSSAARSVVIRLPGGIEIDLGQGQVTIERVIDQLLDRDAADGQNGEAKARRSKIESEGQPAVIRRAPAAGRRQESAGSC